MAKITTRNAYNQEQGQHKNKFGQTITLNFDNLDSLMATGPQIFEALDEAKQNFEKLYIELINIFEQLRGQRINSEALNDPKLIEKELHRIRMDQNDILGDLEKVINGEFTGLNDNMVQKLLNNNQVNSDLNSLLNNYINTYTTYYNKFCEATSFSEKVGTTMRGEKQLHQFGFLSEKGLTEAYLDEKAMSAFRQDRNIFRLRLEAEKDASGRFLIDNNGMINIKRTSLSTRYGLTESNIIDSVAQIQKQNIGFIRQRTVSNPNDINVKSTYNFATQLWGDDNLLAGRWNEAMLAGFISNNPNIDTRSSEFRDNLMWFWGGDQNFSFNRQRFQISQKGLDFISYNNSGYGFRLGSLKSLETIRDLMYNQQSQPNTEIWQGSWNGFNDKFLNHMSYYYQNGPEMNIEPPDEVLDSFYQDMISDFSTYTEVTDLGGSWE